MSRVGDGDGDEEFPNAWAFWHHREQQVLNGKRGRKALADLRDALHALPEKRLIARALCTVGRPAPVTPDYLGEEAELVREQGEGVCAVGAYAWFKRVQSGMDPDEAFRSLPLAADFEDPYATIDEGARAGLGVTLAWVLMSLNDDAAARLTPEDRYEHVLRWIDARLDLASG